MPYGQIMNCWPFLEWEADPGHVEIILETLGSPSIKRSIIEVSKATDLSDAHATACRSLYVRINCVAYVRLDIVSATKEMARWMPSTNLHGVGDGKAMWWVRVGQTESGAEIRDATTS